MYYLTTALLGVGTVLLFSSYSSATDKADDAAALRARQYYCAGQFDQAVGECQRALARNPSNQLALYLLGNCFYRANQQSSARAAYQRAYSVDKHSQIGALAQAMLAKLGGSELSTMQADVFVHTNAAQTGSSINYPITGGAASSPAEQGARVHSGGSFHGDFAGSTRFESSDLASLPERASFYFTRAAHGHMAVDITINGHPIKAWFDTGAGAFFYKDQLREAGIDTSAARPAGSTHGWAGVPVSVLSMPADVRLGSLTRRINIRMEESTTGAGQNLIGQDFIKGYQYEIDDKAGRVNLVKSLGNNGNQFDRLYDVPCRVQGKRDIVELEVNGRKIDALLDTGSSSTIIDPRMARQLGLETTGEVERMVGVGGSTAASVAEANLRLGPINRNNFRVLIGGSGGSCIGQDFMEGWRVKMDREHSLLRFFH